MNTASSIYSYVGSIFVKELWVPILKKKGKHTGKPASLEKKWGKEFKNILEKKASILDV